MQLPFLMHNLICDEIKFILFGDASTLNPDLLLFKNLKKFDFVLRSAVFFFQIMILVYIK